jgi:hypothetical protein
MSAVPSSSPLPSAAAPKVGEVAAVSSPFHIVATGVKLLPTESGLLLFDGDDTLATVNGDTIVAYPHFLGTNPFGKNADITIAGGKWPDHGLITLNDQAYAPRSFLYEKSGDGWRKLGTATQGEWYDGVQLWNNGRKLALTNSTGSHYRWEIIAGPKGAVPQPTPYTDDPHNARVTLRAFAVLPSGEVFTVGIDASQKFTCAVERWAIGATKGVVDVLPPPASGYAADPKGIVATRPNSVYVYGDTYKIEGLIFGKKAGAYLAHFDGTAWSLLATPSNAGISMLAVGDNAVWALGGGVLFKQRLGKADWDLVPMPSEDEVRKAVVDELPFFKDKPVELKVSQLHVDEQNMVWLGATAGQSLYVILRNRPFSSIWRASRLGADR